MFEKEPNQAVFKTGFYGFFYRRFLLFGGVMFLIVYLCLATSFKTLITPVFLCVLSKALAMNHHLLTYLEKSITQKVNKS